MDACALFRQHALINPFRGGGKGTSEIVAVIPATYLTQRALRFLWLQIQALLRALGRAHY